MEKVTGLFFKQYHSILQLKLHDKRKMILCALMSTYERFFDGKLEYKGIKYHFYCTQKSLYDGLGMAQRTFENHLAWLKKNDYISFEAKNRKGSIYRTTYFYINSDIINLVVPQESEDNENAEQQSIIPTKEIEEEKTISIEANNTPTETIEIEEVLTSIENNTIPMEVEDIEEEITTSTEINDIPTEVIDIITEPTEENVDRVVILLLRYIKDILEHASLLPKSAMNEAKGCLIKFFGIDTVRKAMYKCLDDGWFRIVDADLEGDYNYYGIKDYGMVYRKITFKDLDDLDYNELYNKATNNK